MTVELLKSPTEEDIIFCRQCTLNTVGKETTKLPTSEWLRKLIESEHSPIRELTFAFKLTIPYYVSVHFVRHHVGVNHYVQSQRNDRQNNYDRNKAPQDSMVSHIISMNLQAFVTMAHARLCTQADPTTRMIMEEMCRQAIEYMPELECVLVPKCAYRGGKCTEFKCCGLNKKYIDNVNDK